MIVRCLPSTDPLVYARRLRQQPHLALLDSAMRHAALGRYSFVACDPFGLFEVREGRAFWNGAALEGAPLAALRTLLARYPQQARDDLPPFQGGALGYIGYEFGNTLETLPRLGGDDDIAQVQLGFYDVVVAIDHVEDRAWLISTGWPEQDPAKRRERAERRADAFGAWLENADRQPTFRTAMLRSAASLGVEFRSLRL